MTTATKPVTTATKPVTTATKPTIGAISRHPQPTESSQWVSFRLGDEEYGVEIAVVHEIVMLGETTRVPGAPNYVRGLINLRSEVIPVVDMRRRFGMPDQSPTEETRVVVVDVQGKRVGMIVDAVNEVLRAPLDHVIPPPPAITGSGHEYVTGLLAVDDRLLILLDIDRVMETETGEAVVEAVAVCR